MFVEKNYTGKQVQDAHIQMSKKPREYGKIILPANRDSITVRHVLDTSPGIGRDSMIRAWCISVWAAFSNQHDKIISLTEKLLAK